MLDSPETPNLQAKSYLANDPALIVLYKQLRDKTLQTLKGASKISPRAEWDFVVQNARLYDRMGCDLLALDLGLSPPVPSPLPPKTLIRYTQPSPPPKKKSKEKTPPANIPIQSATGPSSTPPLPPIPPATNPTPTTPAKCSAAAAASWWMICPPARPTFTSISRTGR